MQCVKAARCTYVHVRHKLRATSRCRFAVTHSANGGIAGRGNFCKLFTHMTQQHQGRVSLLQPCLCVWHVVRLQNLALRYELAHLQTVVQGLRAKVRDSDSTACNTTTRQRQLAAHSACTWRCTSSQPRINEVSTRVHLHPQLQCGNHATSLGARWDGVFACAALGYRY